MRLARRVIGIAAVAALLWWLGAAFAVAGLWAPATFTAAGPVAPAPWPAQSTVPRFRHVFLIVMENRPASAVYGGGGYLAGLARRYAVETDYYAMTHPSLPNYLALLGGSTFGVRTDCASCFVHAPNLVDSLEAAHRTWGAYMEGLPAAGSMSASDWPTLYMGKHDPFRYFDDIRTRPARRRRIQPLSSLWPSLRAGRAPAFIWITPNLCHDMHSCPAFAAQNWLRLVVPRILDSSAWRRGGVLFITWDEGKGARPGAPGAGGRVALLAISAMSRPGGRLSLPANHESLLHTIEAALGVRCVGASCKAPLLGGLFRRPA